MTRHIKEAHQVQEVLPLSTSSTSPLSLSPCSLSASSLFSLPKTTDIIEVEEEDPEMDGLCEYEKIRLGNIRQREALMAELALKEAVKQARESSGVDAPGASGMRSSRREKVEKEGKDPTEPVRKSLRLAGGKVPEIKRFTFEQFEFLDEQLKSRKIRPEDFYLDDELVSRNIAVEEREKMLEEMAAKARTFTGKTERPDGLREVESDRFRILHVPKKCTIKQFVLSNSLEFKCGRGFYEFTKPEIVSHKKEVQFSFTTFFKVVVASDQV